MNTAKSLRILVCLAIIVGFFLTWMHGYKNFSGLQIVTTGSLWKGSVSFLVRFGLLLVPILPVIILFNTLSNESSGLLLRCGPLLVIVIYAGLILLGLSQVGGEAASEARSEIAKSLGLGFYISAIGSVILPLTSE